MVRSSCVPGFIVLAIVLAIGRSLPLCSWLLCAALRSNGVLLLRASPCAPGYCALLWCALLRSYGALCSSAPLLAPCGQPACYSSMGDRGAPVGDLYFHPFRLDPLSCALRSNGALLLRAWLYSACYGPCYSALAPLVLLAFVRSYGALLLRAWL